MRITEVTKRLLDNKKKLLIIVGSAAVLGLIVGLIIPDNYYSQARFITISGGGSKSPLQQRGLERFKRLAGLAGDEFDDEFDPALMPEIIFNRDLFQHIIHRKVPVTADGDSLIFLHYLLFEGQPDEDGEEILSNFELGSPPIITKEYVALQEYFFQTITFDVDLESEVVTIGASFNSPVLAEYITRQLIQYVESYMTRYALEKKKQEIEYLDQRKNKITSKYEESGLKIAEFLTIYQDLFDEKVKFEYKKLKNEHDINYGILNEVSAKLELAKFKFEEQKPIIYFIEQPVINSESTAPGIAKLIVLFVFLSGAISVILLFRMEILEFITNG